jgi:hypothetical protein
MSIPAEAPTQRCRQLFCPVHGVVALCRLLFPEPDTKEIARYVCERCWQESKRS